MRYCYKIEESYFVAYSYSNGDAVCSGLGNEEVVLTELSDISNTILLDPYTAFNFANEVKESRLLARDPDFNQETRVVILNFILISRDVDIVSR